MRLSIDCDWIGCASVRYFDLILRRREQQQSEKNGAADWGETYLSLFIDVDSKVLLLQVLVFKANVTFQAIPDSNVILLRHAYLSVGAVWVENYKSAAGKVPHVWVDFSLFPRISFT